MRLKIRDIYPDLRELDSYSIEVSGWIHRVYPHWTSYIKVDRYKRTVELHGPGAEFSEEELFLGIHVSAPVPAPHSSSRHDLIISTQSNDLTVHFDGFHAHFGRFHRTVKEAFPAAKAFIDDLLQEKIVVLVGVNRCGGCCPPDHLEETMQKWKSEGYNIDYTRSWRGTYNRVYEFDVK